MLFSIMPQANAAMPTGDPAPRFYQTHNGKTAVTKMRNERMAEINARINALDDENRGNSHIRIASAGDFEPDFSFGPTTGFGDIDGPNGEMWFYSMETVQEPIEYEFFTDYRLCLSLSQSTTPTISLWALSAIKFTT